MSETRPVVTQCPLHRIIKWLLSL